MRVLLVEDESLVRMATAEMLRDEGFEVTEAWNGDEAAGLQDSFDVLFTDVQMPGALDGIDVAMQLRQHDPTLPVLIVSGYAADLTSRLGELHPPAVFIGKPYDLPEIVAALHRMTLGFDRNAPVEMAMSADGNSIFGSERSARR